MAIKSQKKKKCELNIAKEFASECDSFCERNDRTFLVAAQIPCGWTFATIFAGDCECDGLMHSARPWADKKKKNDTENNRPGIIWRLVMGYHTTFFFSVLHW